MSTKRRALVIAHEPDGPAGQIAVRLTQRGYQVDTHVVTHDYDQPNLAAPFPDFADYDIVLPMGSVRSLTNTDEIESWIHEELALIRSAHERGTPILGVCFGGQLIAKALGGSVEVAPVTEIGWHTLEPGPDGEVPGASGPWMEWHHDRFIAPPDAEVLAVTEHATQLIKIGTTVGTQFHPEVDNAHIAGWLEQADDEYLGKYERDRDTIAGQMAENQARNTEQCHRFVDWFLDEVAADALND